ncbi:hypothetical protein HMPREF9093_02140 [Fusobacterium sp. oral taxon 370 str. F0437]|nr:hypothetical protein HMPREF9093_02140 [Fusobacterium sp. oral taxon 370 str. F0437]
MATCQPLIFQELHKGSFNINGCRSSLFRNILFIIKFKKVR